MNTLIVVMVEQSPIMMLVRLFRHYIKHSKMAISCSRNFLSVVNAGFPIFSLQGLNDLL